MNDQLSLLPDPGKTLYKAMTAPNGKIWVMRCEIIAEVSDLLAFHDYINTKHKIKRD